MRRRRLRPPLLALILLALAYGFVQTRHLLFPKRLPPWFDEREEVLAFLEQAGLTLPDGAPGPNGAGPPVPLRREDIADLRVEPGGFREDDSDGARVTFVADTDRGRFAVDGTVTLHGFDGSFYPWVNLGQGWMLTPLDPPPNPAPPAPAGRPEPPAP